MDHPTYHIPFRKARNRHVRRGLGDVQFKSTLVKILDGERGTVVLPVDRVYSHIHGYIV